MWEDTIEYGTESLFFLFLFVVFCFILILVNKQFFFVFNDSILLIVTVNP